MPKHKYFCTQIIQKLLPVIKFCWHKFLIHVNWVKISLQRRCTLLQIHNGGKYQQNLQMRNITSNLYAAYLLQQRITYYLLFRIRLKLVLLLNFQSQKYNILFLLLAYLVCIDYLELHQFFPIYVLPKNSTKIYLANSKCI